MSVRSTTFVSGRLGGMDITWPEEVSGCLEECGNVIRPNRKNLIQAKIKREWLLRIDKSPRNLETLGGEVVGMFI
jgi:hypothetical protein